MVPTPTSAPAAGAGAGGGMLGSIVSGVAQGMMFGTGSAIAHRAVDAVAGPRTVVHEHVGQQQQDNSNAAAQPAAAAASAWSNDSSMRCTNETNEWQRCLRDNGNNVNACSLLYNSLVQCQNLKN